LFVDGIGLFSVLIPFHFCVCAHCNILRAALCLAGLNHWPWSDPVGFA
jgi:hypothetical protein